MTTADEVKDGTEELDPETSKVYKTEEDILNSGLPDGQQIELLLEKGYSKKALLSLGFSESYIRQKLKKRAKEGKMAVATTPAGLDSVVRGTEKITPFHTIDLISNLLDGNEEQRAIFKAGMLVPILGMQMFQEGQKSFSSYYNAMKQDNLEAVMKTMGEHQMIASQAAQEASMVTATRVAEIAAEGRTDAAIVSAKNPGQAMAMKTMMPLMENMMNMLVGRLTPGMAQQPGGALPQGWTRKQE